MMNVIAAACRSFSEVRASFLKAIYAEKCKGFMSKLLVRYWFVPLAGRSGFVKYLRDLDVPGNGRVGRGTDCKNNGGSLGPLMSFDDNSGTW
jgi:hypothetical protein